MGIVAGPTSTIPIGAVPLGFTCFGLGTIGIAARTTLAIDKLTRPIVFALRRSLTGPAPAAGVTGAILEHAHPLLLTADGLPTMIPIQRSNTSSIGVFTLPSLSARLSGFTVPTIRRPMTFPLAPIYRTFSIFFAGGTVQAEASGLTVGITFSLATSVQRLDFIGTLIPHLVLVGALLLALFTLFLEPTNLIVLVTTPGPANLRTITGRAAILAVLNLTLITPMVTLNTRLTA